MIDGATYYNQQSSARRISSISDVEKIADAEKKVFDRLLLPYIAASPQARIYEAACGPGILQCWLKKHGLHNVEGSDFSEFEASLAAQINNRIRSADSLTHLSSFAESSFDVIIALDFYEHLPKEDFRRFLSIAHKALKTGGLLIMRGPNGDSPFVGLNLYNDITHIWAYTSTSLKALLTIAGYHSTHFEDDTCAAIHYGRWWKKPLMIVARLILRSLVHAATRQSIEHWGSSLYVYARK
jgi:2-polyprenyl-3-methyl-5-hydroxy-6-metoxy-1,4-benzoquinol methylase